MTLRTVSIDEKLREHIAKYSNMISHTVFTVHTIQYCEYCRH